jgi:hypothetical protein
MSIDEIPQFRSKTARLRRRVQIREQHEKNRRERGQKIARSQAMQNHQDDENMFSPSQDPFSTPKSRFQSMPTESLGKRKGPYITYIPQYLSDSMYNRFCRGPLRPGANGT